MLARSMGRLEQSTPRDVLRITVHLAQMPAPPLAFRAAPGCAITLGGSMSRSPLLFGRSTTQLAFVRQFSEHLIAVHNPQI
jgi:hypothetical protein